MLVSDVHRVDSATPTPRSRLGHRLRHHFPLPLQPIFPYATGRNDDLLMVLFCLHTRMLWNSFTDETTTGELVISRKCLHLGTTERWQF